jgi:regulator of protease activity HflC (stomatin/prohibitin superfamily)
MVLAVAVVMMLLLASIRVVWQYQRGVHFRLGRVIGVREPGLRFIIPVIDRLWRVSMRIVTMPIQSQGIITSDNVSVGIAAARGRFHPGSLRAHRRPTGAASGISDQTGR